MDKLEKTLKKAFLKSKKCCRDNSNSDSKSEIGLGSTRKLGLNLEKAVKWSKFTLPSPIKATHTEIACGHNVAHPVTFCNADDIMLMPPSQSKDVHDNNSTHIASSPPEGRTTAVIAVMRGNPKDGCTRLCSNKDCKQKDSMGPIRQWF